MVLSKTSDHIQIKTKIQNPSQEPPASSKAPNVDLKDMDVLCTFKIKIESKNLKCGWTKDQWQICKTLVREPPASSKAPNQDLKDMDVLCTFKIKIEIQNLENGCIKNQWSYPNQDQDAKPKSGTSSVPQSPKSGLKGHWCSLHLQTQDRDPKFRIWLYQRPVNISKSIWGCKTKAREPPAFSKAQNQD